MDSVIRIKGRFPNVQFHDRGGFQSRHGATLDLLRDTLTRYSEVLQDRTFDFFICSFDNPESANALAEKVPYVLTYSVSNQCRPNILAMPDFIFGGWPEVGITSYDQTTQEILQAGQKPPTNDKLFWIGSVPTDPSRAAMCEIGQHYPDDMHFIGMQWQDSRDPSLHRLPANAYVSLPDHCTYSMLIDIRGAGYSGRLKLLMFANRPLFIVERRFREYFFEHLRPWEHFVPVKDDLSDLTTQVKLVKSRPDLARQLGANAVAFAQRYLTRDYAMQYLRDLLVRISA